MSASQSKKTQRDKPTNMGSNIGPAHEHMAFEIPGSILVSASVHPREAEMSQQVNDYFLARWPFPNEKARLKFVKAGFSRVTCAYFPSALDDRIFFACQLLTLLFLVDG